MALECSSEDARWTAPDGAIGPPACGDGWEVVVILRVLLAWTVVRVGTVDWDELEKALFYSPESIPADVIKLDWLALLDSGCDLKSNRVFTPPSKWAILCGFRRRLPQNSFLGGPTWQQTRKHRHQRKEWSTMTRTRGLRRNMRSEIRRSSRTWPGVSRTYRMT